MISASVLIVLIVVLGAIAMMLIAAVSRRGLEISRSKIVFAAPEAIHKTDTGARPELGDTPVQVPKI